MICKSLRWQSYYNCVTQKQLDMYEMNFMKVYKRVWPTWCNLQWERYAQAMAPPPRPFEREGYSYVLKYGK